MGQRRFAVSLTVAFRTYLLNSRIVHATAMLC